MPTRSATRASLPTRATVILGAAGLGLILMAAPAARASDPPGYRFLWVRTILGPCCGDAGVDLEVDSDGGVLVAGHRGGLDLDRDGKVDIRSHGTPDPLVFKAYDDPDRGWVLDPGGPSRDDAWGVTPDRSGGAYAVGEFMESMQIAGGTISSAGRRDGFVARFGPDGRGLWAKAIGGTDHDALQDVASDSQGNAYVIGTLRGAVDVDRDGKVDVNAGNEPVMFLASFDPEGALRWLRTSGGEGSTFGRTMIMGPEDELYVAAFYHGGAPDLDGDGRPEGPPAVPGERGGQATPGSDINAVYARFDRDGNMLWARSASGPAVQIVGSLAVAGNGDLIVAGGQTGSTDLDGDGAIDLEFRSMADRKWEHHADGNTFLLRMTADGERRWARQYMVAAAHVTTDGKRLVLSGSYSGPLDIDGDELPERPADPDRYLEGFVALLDGEGALLHVFTVAGGDSDVVSAAGFSPDGKKLYVTGYTKLGADFDGDGRIESASACHQLGDVYVASYDVAD